MVIILVQDNKYINLDFVTSDQSLLITEYKHHEKDIRVQKSRLSQSVTWPKTHRLKVSLSTWKCTKTILKHNILTVSR